MLPRRSERSAERPLLGQSSHDGSVSRNTEIGILVAVAGGTAISFAIFGVDTLGIIVLSICLVCLGLLVAGPDGD